MKLDYDLLRELLLLVEDISDGITKFSDEHIISLVKSTNDGNAIFYHLKYLDDIGYVERYTTKNAYFEAAYTLDITPTGRTYLNGIRTDGKWDKVKELFSENTEKLSIEAILFVASAIMQKTLNL